MPPGSGSRRSKSSSPQSSAEAAPAGVPIAIVGGGIGGLVLARILRQHGRTATVYELDASAAARHQGGWLDMHQESGLLALKTAGLHDEFRRRMIPNGEAMRVYDKAATLLIDEAPPPEGREAARPEIDRAELRGMLLESLDPGQIVWGHKLATVRAVGDGGRHELSFTNGQRVTADLVIGADGTWSKVRPAVTDAKPAYTGFTYVELHLDDAEARHPASAALVGQGMVLALSDGQGFLGHGGRSITVGAWLRVPESWSADVGIDWQDIPSARGVLLEAFSGWDDSLTDLIRNCDGSRMVCRKTYALPVDHSWDRTAGVTLLGDAAHAMFPFGEGANVAMQDGMELALALVEHDGDVEAALSQYEAAMFPRARAAAEMSAGGPDLLFGHDAPRGLVEMFQQHGSP